MYVRFLPYHPCSSREEHCIVPAICTVYVPMCSYSQKYWRELNWVLNHHYRIWQFGTGLPCRYNYNVCSEEILADIYIWQWEGRLPIHQICRLSGIAGDHLWLWYNRVPMVTVRVQCYTPCIYRYAGCSSSNMWSLHSHLFLRDIQRRQRAADGWRWRRKCLL